MSPDWALRPFCCLIKSSVHSSGWPGTCGIRLPQPPKLWDCRHGCPPSHIQLLSVIWAVPVTGPARQSGHLCSALELASTHSQVSGLRSISLTSTLPSLNLQVQEPRQEQTARLGATSPQLSLLGYLGTDVDQLGGSGTDDLARQRGRAGSQQKRRVPTFCQQFCGQHLFSIFFLFFFSLLIKSLL